MGKYDPAEDVGQVAEDHHHIRQELSAIEQDQDIASLKKRFDEMIATMEEHFALEEKINRDNEIDALNRSANVHKLLEITNEHPQLIEKAKAIRTRLDQDAAYEQIRPAISEFVTHMRDHEERETEVFMDTVWTDIGGGN